MKIKITEQQYKLILEQDNRKLWEVKMDMFDGSGYSDIERYKNMTEIYNQLKDKKGFTGIKIYGDLLLSYDTEIKNSDDIVEVTGDLIMEHSNIETLLNLEKVDGDLKLYNSNIESLPKLTYVGGKLELIKTPITSLPSLEMVEDGILFESTNLISFNDTEILKIYDIDSSVLDTINIHQRLAELGVIEPLEMDFTLELSPISEASYYVDSSDRHYSGDWIEKVMSDSIWDYAYDFEVGLSDALYMTNSENEKIIESLINRQIVESGDEIDEEMSLEEKIEEYDDYDIRHALNSAYNDVASDEYVNYLRKQVINALEEYGTITEYNYEKIEIDINLSEYLDYNDVDFYEFFVNCGFDPKCVFNELLSNGIIDKKTAYFDDRWYPDIDNNTFNEYLKDRLDEIEI